MKKNLPWNRKICGGVECHGKQSYTRENADGQIVVIEGCIYEYDSNNEKVLVENKYGDKFFDEEACVERPVMEYKVKYKCSKDSIQYNYPMFMAMATTLKVLAAKKPPCTPHLRKPRETGRGKDFDLFIEEVYKGIHVYLSKQDI